MTDPIPFLPFRRNMDVRVYRSRGLPHWRQKGATYFVTFRTADSMPSTFREKWAEEKDAWLREKGFDPADEGWREASNDPEGGVVEEYEQWCGERMDHWLDKGAGACLLENPEIGNIAADALRFFDRERYRLGNFVVMPNHVQALMTPLAGFELETVLRSVKGFSAKKINKETGGSGRFWQTGFYDHVVRTGDALLRFQTYIRENPKRAGLTSEKCVSGEAEYEMFGQS